MCAMIAFNRPFARPGHMVQNYILVSKLRSGTSKTKAGALFWKSHCAICSPVYVILYHVTGSCKRPIPNRNTKTLPSSLSFGSHYAELISCSCFAEDGKEMPLFYH